MREAIQYVILGLPFGCVYGLVALGLVLAYRTSGVFNLAFAAQAFLSAAVFYDLHVRRDVPLALAAIVAIFVVSPLAGLALERLIFRWTRTAPPMSRLVAATGVLVALPALVKIVFGDGPAYNPPVLWPSTRAYTLAGYTFGAKDVAIIVATVLAVVGFGAVLRFTSLGTVVYAVVESPRLAGLTGVHADRVSQVAWAMSSVFAGLAGVLLGPLFAQVRDTYFFTVLVSAIAVAAFARLSSLGLTILGGILLGAAQGLLAGFLPSNSVLSNGLRPSLPFLLLFVLLLVRRGLNQADTVDPLAGVDPPSGLAFADAASPARPSWRRRVVHVLVVAAIVAAIVNHYPEVIWLPWITETLILTVIYLSVTVFTGWGGQLSLCQLTFAAIGAYTTGQLSSSAGIPVLLAIAAGTVVATAVGALLAVPTMRLSGIYLALATLAFALMFSNVIEPLAWVTGGSAVPQKVPRPQVGPIDFASDRTFLVLAVVACIAVCAAVIVVTRGTTGRYLSALRGSEVAAQAIGINPRTVRLVAFATSAAIAGLGGGLLATYREAARTADFDYLTGLLVVASVVTLGSRTIEGAFNAALGVAVFGVVVFDDFLPWLLSSVQPWHDFDAISHQWVSVLFGLGAITYAKNPDGILAAFRRSSARTRRSRRTPAPSDAVPRAPTTGAVITA